MKIKKKDEKPMVIHQKAKPKVHVAGRKANPVKAKSEVTVKRNTLRGRSGSRTENGTDTKTESSLKDAFSGRQSRYDGRKSGYDGRGNGQARVRKDSLKVMASASAKKTLSEIDGEEEVKDSLDLMGTAAAPIFGLQSGSARVYRKIREKKTGREKERKSEKDRERKSRKNGIRTEDEKAKSMHIRRKSVEAKKNGSRGKKGSEKVAVPEIGEAYGRAPPAGSR